jgi:hypothetical protein
MQRLFLTSFLLVVLSSAFSQNKFITDRYPDDFDWSSYELELDQDDKNTFHLWLRDHFEYFSKNRYDYYYGDFRKGLHYTDLNGDDMPDVIINGWTGGEGDMLGFYINTGHSFEEWFVLYQHPLEIVINDGTLEKVAVHNPGCCAEHIETFEFYDIPAFPMEPLLEKQINLAISTEIEGESINPVRFRISMDEYSLRSSPEISEDEVDEIWGPEAVGNRIAILIKGQSGNAYKKATDNTGRVWWLTETDAIALKEGSIFYQEGPKQHFCGWISSRFVEVIE